MEGKNHVEGIKSLKAGDERLILAFRLFSMSYLMTRVRLWEETIGEVVDGCIVLVLVVLLQVFWGQLGCVVNATFCQTATLYRPEKLS